MPGFLSLVRRRWQVLASSNNAQEQLDAAEALVLQSRQKATRAKNRLEEHRGVGSLPNAENPQSADIELIAALDQYDQVRRAVEVPLEEAIHLWKQGEEARRVTRSRSNVFRSLFMLSYLSTDTTTHRSLHRSSVSTFSLTPSVALSPAVLKAVSPLALPLMSRTLASSLALSQLPYADIKHLVRAISSCKNVPC